MNKKYILFKKAIITNYKYSHKLTKGGIIGIYSMKQTAENKRDILMKDLDLSINDFMICEVEWE